MAAENIRYPFETISSLNAIFELPVSIRKSYARPFWLSTCRMPCEVIGQEESWIESHA
jgi:hypothetical protein